MFFTDFYRFIRIFREISGNLRKLREISKPIFTDNDCSHLIERSRTIYIVLERSIKCEQSLSVNMGLEISRNFRKFPEISRNIRINR